MNTTQELSIYTAAVDRAEKILKAAGCQYAIVMGNGEKRGELPLAPAPKAAKRVFRRFASNGYREIMEAMGVGDVRFWDVDTEDDAKAMRGCVSATCVTFWGKGSGITTVSKTSTGQWRVEVMRTA